MNKGNGVCLQVGCLPTEGGLHWGGLRRGSAYEGVSLARSA